MAKVHCNLCHRRIRVGQIADAHGNHATKAECEAGSKTRVVPATGTATTVVPKLTKVVKAVVKAVKTKDFKPKVQDSSPDFLFKLKIGKAIRIPKSLLRFQNRHIETTETPFVNMTYDGWTGSTSWREEFLRKNQHNNFGFLLGENSMRLLCHYNLQRKIAGQYSAYCEPLAGAGFDAKIFEQEPTQVFLNDFDPLCQEILRLNFPSGHVTGENVGCACCRTKYYGGPTRISELIFLDFNDFTIGKFCKCYNDLTTATFQMPNARFVVLNDCAPFLLAHGKNGYGPVSRVLGVTVATKEEYFTALKTFYKKWFPEWQLTDVEHFNASSYQLFRKQSDNGQPLQIHYNTREDLAKDPMLVVEG